MFVPFVPLPAGWEEDENAPLPRWIRGPSKGYRYYRAASGNIHVTVGPGYCWGCKSGDPQRGTPNCLTCAIRRAR